MPQKGPGHRWSALPWALVVATLGACSRDRGSELTVLLDATPAPRSVEALLLPVDPSTVPSVLSSQRTVLPASAADSVLRYRRLADSSEQLDRSFQLSRDALNREARALDGMDRRTRAYAERFFAFRRRELEAEAIRHARDRARARVATLRARLGGTLEERERLRDEEAQQRRGALDALVADARHARAVRMTAPAMTRSLEPGVWWVGIAPRGGVPDRFQRVVLRAGARDTVRFSVDLVR